MNTSETVVEIQKALIGFQSEMESVKKGKINPFFKSKYADLPSILQAIKPHLAKWGLGILHSSTGDGLGILNVETRLVHMSGEWIETNMMMLVAKQDPQSCGSSLTYGRRYGLQSILSLSAEDDDGAGAMAHSQDRR